MRIIEKILKGTCVYWPQIGTDGFGQPTFGDPQEMRCRWEGVTRQVTTADGRMIMSQARVYVETDVAVGGVLLEKSLAETTSLTVPFDNAGAFEVMKFDKMPTLKYTQYLRTVWL